MQHANHSTPPPRKMHPTPDNLRRGYLNALGVITIWTCFVIFSRMSGKSDLTAYDVIALRYGVAGIAILPLWLAHRSNIFEWKKLILTLIGAVGFTLFAMNGFRHAPANHAAILLQGFLPFTVAVMAYFLAGERPTRQRITGLVLIAIGVSSLALEVFTTNGVTLLGDGLLVGASLCWAMYTVLLRRWRYKPMDATIAVTLLAALLYLPAYAVFLPKNIANVPWQECLAYGMFQGVLVAIIQMIFYTNAVHYLGASRLAILASVVPVLASLGAVPILDEPLTIAIAAGLVFACLGAWVGNRQSR
jgi:drug/metabolite transporter (DMT)-like permease